MELVSYCYDPTWFRLFQARNKDFWEHEGGDLEFLKDKSITEAIAMASYGQVTEITNSDGERQLVCRYSNNKDWQVGMLTEMTKISVLAIIFQSVIKKISVNSGQRGVTCRL